MAGVVNTNDDIQDKLIAASEKAVAETLKVAKAQREAAVKDALERGRREAATDKRTDVIVKKVKDVVHVPAECVVSAEFFKLLNEAGK